MTELLLRFLLAALITSAALLMIACARAIRRLPEAASPEPEEETSVLVLCLSCAELMEHSGRWFCPSCWSALPHPLQARIIDAWASDRSGETVGARGALLEAGCEWLRRARAGAVNRV